MGYLLEESEANIAQKYNNIRKLTRCVDRLLRACQLSDIIPRPDGNSCPVCKAGLAIDTVSSYSDYSNDTLYYHHHTTNSKCDYEYAKEKKLLGFL